MPKRAKDNGGNSRFGKVLYRAREKLKLGLRELAERVELSAGYLSRLESGAVKSPPSEDAIQRLAKALDVSSDELVCAAGRVPEDVVVFITRHPDVLPKIRSMRAAAARA